MPTVDELWLPPSFNRNQKKSPRKHGGGIFKELRQRSGFADRTLWDWVQFFAVLAIPVLVAAGSLYFTQQITLQQTQISQEQHQVDIQNTQDQQKESELESYISNMQNLLLNYNLQNSKPGDEVRSVAEARTVATLQQLDGVRKAVLLLFLYQAHLINAPISSSDQVNPVVSLVGANLSNVNFQVKSIFGNSDIIVFRSKDGPSNIIPELFNVCEGKEITLFNINLSGAILENANLFCVNMKDADLAEADLTGANVQSDLTEANLNGAILTNSDLNGANFREAVLTHAQFCYVFTENDSRNLCANISATDFRGADLSNSDFDEEKAFFDEPYLTGATMPDGSTYP